MTTGSKMGADPICTIPSTSTAKAGTPTWGTPAIFSPIPASSDCSTATPITPCATVRIVAPANARKSALRCGTIRVSTVLTELTRPSEAEVAFVVVDAFQGQGIGALLTRHLTGLARAAGLKELVADVLPENMAMRKVLGKFGFRTARSLDPQVVHLTLPLV
jgi:hypothetical protein